MKNLLIPLLAFTILVGGMIACEQSPEASSREPPAPSPETLDPDVQAAIQSLGDESEDVREAAFEALVNIGPEAIPALTQALRENKDKDVRWAAATVMGEIGPEAAEAIPALTQALEEDEDK
jgi:transcriptional/translational regulatory protein YebC/TACO1